MIRKLSNLEILIKKNSNNSLPNNDVIQITSVTDNNDYISLNIAGLLNIDSIDNKYGLGLDEINI